MNRNPARLGDLAALVSGELDGNPEILIHSAAPIQSAAAGDISFIANPRYEKHVADTHASALVVAPNITGAPCALIRHPNPYLAFARIVSSLYPETTLIPVGVDGRAVVDHAATVASHAGVGPMCQVGKEARVGERTQLVSGVYVGDYATIGDDCVIYPGVRIMEGCRIGNRVRIHSGAVIGSDGFGFAPDGEMFEKIRQVGWVEIGDDVEIGANTTIDRGALGPTRIGAGTKIDNLVQIGHNVEIGRNCIIVAQVGISGSTRLGDNVMLAGQVGLVGHIEIGDRVMIGAQSGVPRSIPAGKVYFGYPAREIMESKRIEAALSRLPDLFKRVRKLEEQSGT